MQTPITGDTSAFPTLHFHLKERSVDCAKKKKKKETRTKLVNTAGSTLSQCLGNCKLKSQEVGSYTCVGYEGPCI